MTDASYKFDVAFSFLKEDEELALAINNLLKDRISTFIYSHRQDEIAGADGEIKFNQIFGSDARLVVVIYREGWGTTPWTRIEETAIRNRGYENGYDFVVFIPIGAAPKVPRWLPKNRIWIGIDRWGVTGAASVIEARVQEEGGAPHEESVRDRAERLSREVLLENKRTKLNRSQEGVKAACEEVDSLLATLKALSESINRSEIPIKYVDEVPKTTCAIFGTNATITVSWHSRYTNSLDQAYLKVETWKGMHPYRLGAWHLEDPVNISRALYAFDLNTLGENGWRSRSDDTEFFTTARLADEIMKLLLDTILCVKLEDNDQ